MLVDRPGSNFRKRLHKATEKPAVHDATFAIPQTVRLLDSTSKRNCYDYVMRCPRCNSSRIQRGYNAVAVPLRLMKFHELLCNNCNLEFKSIDLFKKFKRIRSVEKEPSFNRRRAPRFHAHLPATIYLAEKTPATANVSYSRSSLGHCEVISKYGAALAFVGTRFAEREIKQIGRLLFVTIDLPNGRIEALLSILSCQRSGNEEGKGKWLVGGAFSNINEEHSALLSSYLEKRKKAEPVLGLD